jgi:hypothetical protein
MLKTSLLSLLGVLCLGLLAKGQVDLSGSWTTRAHEDQQDRTDGPDPVSFMRFPLSPEGRSRALSYSNSILSLPEHECEPYPPYYVLMGPQAIGIRAEQDPDTGALVAWKITPAVDRGPITIWMDGRSHPGPNALHSFEGFTTGKWEGETLTTYTTHIKEGFLTRNGVVTSDRTTVGEHYSRHGDTLTITAIVTDPIYLAEPFVVSRSWQLGRNIISEAGSPCIPAVEVESLQGGVVPSYPPDKNPFINEVHNNYNIPVEAVVGGAFTMYPEYQKELKNKYKRPAECKRYCSGSNGVGGAGAPLPGRPGGSLSTEPAPVPKK